MIVSFYQCFAGDTRFFLVFYLPVASIKSNFIAILQLAPVVLPYIISGTFGSVYTPGSAGPPVVPATTVALPDFTDFDSAVGPATNLLDITANTPASTPDMEVLLKPQTDGTAKAGNYADTLTLTVIVL